MPMYTFKCGGCGVQSEAVVKRKTKKVECNVCGEMAARELSRDVAATFQSGASMSQKTGVQELDFDYDRAIGEDSRRKWDTINKRTAHKQSVVSSTPGAEIGDLSRNPDGSYVVMPKQVRQTVDSARKEAHKSTST